MGSRSALCFTIDRRLSVSLRWSGRVAASWVPLLLRKTADIPRSFCNSWTRSLICVVKLVNACRWPIWLARCHCTPMTEAARVTAVTTSSVVARAIRHAIGVFAPKRRSRCIVGYRSRPRGPFWVIRYHDKLNNSLMAPGHVSPTGKRQAPTAPKANRASRSIFSAALTMP